MPNPYIKQQAIVLDMLEYLKEKQDAESDVVLFAQHEIQNMINGLRSISELLGCINKAIQRDL